MNFIENESAQKLRGGYYTPIDLASYITRWVVEKSPKDILEPSCGDGVFFEAIGANLRSREMNLKAFEIVKEEAAKAALKAQKIPNLSTQIVPDDFLDWAIPRMADGVAAFDAVVGNPPFIRYQYLSDEAQQRAEAVFKLLQLPFTKHTNAWVPFVLSSIALLKPGGRLGMIVPSEIIHVAHAQSLRTYLGSACSRLLIIDPEELWFDGTLQGAVILLAEKKTAASDPIEGLGIAKVSGRAFAAEDPSRLFNSTQRMNGKTVEGKWTRALLTSNERALVDQLRAHEHVHRFDDIAEVDVGIVTGANKFFLVSDEVVKEFSLEEFAHPMFGRSEHCPGIIYDVDQHKQNAANGNPTNFLWLKDLDAKRHARAIEYVKLGEADSLHTRYKCRIRKPWYTVPSVYATNIGMLKRAHDMPRLILNRAEAYTTDTAYRITSLDVSPESLVYSFMNSLTALTAELEGRHYGGGVLELVPSEIERLLIPLPPKAKHDVQRLDTVVRSTRIADLLPDQDRRLLGAIGLSAEEQSAIRDAWWRLRNRRQRIGGSD